MPRPTPFLAILVLACATAPPAASQGPLAPDAAGGPPAATTTAAVAERRVVRVGVGAGAGSAGLTMAVDAAVHDRGRLYRGRMTAHTSMGAWGPDQEAHLSELAVLYGAGHRFSRNYGLVAAGLSLVAVEHRDRTVTTPGVPVEAQLVSGGPLRLGIAAMANLNAEKPFTAIILSVPFGGVPYPPLR